MDKSDIYEQATAPISDIDDIIDELQHVRKDATGSQLASIEKAIDALVEASEVLVMMDSGEDE